MGKEIKCELMVIGYDCPSEDITRIMGSHPTEIIKKGTVWHADPDNIQPPVLHKQDVWILRSDLSLDTDPEDHIQAMMDRIRPNAKLISELAKKYPVELSVFGTTHDEHVGLHLEKDIVQEMAKLGIAFDFDVY